MQRRRFLRLLAGGTALALTPGLAACSYEYEGRSRWYPYPSGYYEYYYYPEANVYFHIGSGYYYFPRYGVWIRSRSLPDHFHLRPDLRRRLVIRHPRPYELNPEHRREWERHRESERHRETERYQSAPRAPLQDRPEPRPERRPERRPAPRAVPPPDSDLRRETERRRITHEERRRIESESRQRRSLGSEDWRQRRLD